MEFFSCAVAIRSVALRVLLAVTITTMVFVPVSGFQHRLLLSEKLCGCWSRTNYRRIPIHALSQCQRQLHLSLNSDAGNTIIPESSKNMNIRQKKYEELMDASTLSLAPMMEYTDRHFRHLVRLISSRTLLYTEMVVANSLSHERRDRVEEYRSEHLTASEEEVHQHYNDQHLRRYLGQGRIEPLEGPSVLQIGGSDPEQMFQAAETVMDMTERQWCDYTAINLNCGCPSPKVAGKGCFGAALMDDPKLVAELTKALHDGCDGKLPITVKCRIGTDSDNTFNVANYAVLDPEIEYRKLYNFVETVASNGIVTDFSVHARIAVLNKKFSPADNRKIPPLKYDMVRRLVNDFPEFTFTMNGCFDNMGQVQKELADSPGLKGIMVGRAWVANPWSFAMADQLLYNSPSAPVNRLDILKKYGEHADAEEATGDPSNIRRFIVKAINPLFHSEPRAKRYRIALDEIACLPKKLEKEGKTLEGQPPLSELIMNAAYEHLSEEVLLRTPQESYERILFEEQKVQNGKGDRSVAIQEWQAQHKIDQAAAASVSDNSVSQKI